MALKDIPSGGGRGGKVSARGTGGERKEEDCSPQEKCRREKLTYMIFIRGSFLRVNAIWGTKKRRFREKKKNNKPGNRQDQKGARSLAILRENKGFTK